jgi:hypothetical protein
MSGAARADTRDRAGEVRTFLRARRTRWRPTAYQIYATLLIGAIAGALGGHAVSSLIGGSLNAHKLAVFGPAVLILVLLATLRFGTWQGPVGFSTADVSFLLTAPIAIAELVRPKLDLGLWLGAAAGALVAGLALLLMSGGTGDIGVARALGAVAGLAGFAVVGVASSWLVESSRRVSTFVRRASPALLALAAVLIAVSAASVGRSVAVWSGPWGWAIAPLAGSPGWPLAVLLIVIAAGATTALARRRAGAAGAEAFLTRAETRSGLTASAFTLDYRSAALTYRSALPARVIRHTGVPRPTQPRRVVLWRDALALLREPSRLGWAMLLGAAGTVEALTHPGRALPAAVAAVLLYFAASLLCEPLRTDVDAPDTSALLLSWPFARVLLAHCALPIAVMSGLTAATIVVVVLAGAAGAGALIVIPTVLLPVIVTAVLCAALAARSGGRVDENLLGRLLTLDASNPMGATLVVLWLIPWLIAAIAVIGGAVLILGHAAAHHRAVLGPGIVAVGLTAATGAALAAVARGSKRPDR